MGMVLQLEVDGCSGLPLSPEYWMRIRAGCASRGPTASIERALQGALVPNEPDNSTAP